MWTGTIPRHRDAPSCAIMSSLSCHHCAKSEKASISHRPCLRAACQPPAAPAAKGGSKNTGVVKGNEKDGETTVKGTVQNTAKGL